MMLHTVVLTVRLKITDNEALSALEALHAKMGLVDSVAGLVKEERWELDVDAPSLDEAQAIVETAISLTNIFLNPNKHNYAFSPAVGEGTDLDSDEVAVIVTDRDGADSPRALAAVARAGLAGLTAARRGTRWRIRLTEPPTPGQPEAFDLIQRIGVTTSRDGGLLANPHSQSAVVVLPWGEEKPLEG